MLTNRIKLGELALVFGLLVGTGTVYAQDVPSTSAAPPLTEISTFEDYTTVVQGSTVPVIVEVVGEDDTGLELKLRESAAQLQGQVKIVKVNYHRAAIAVISLIGECSFGDEAKKSDAETDVVACREEFHTLPLRLAFFHGKAVQEMTWGGELLTQPELTQSLRDTVKNAERPAPIVVVPGRAI